MEIEFEHDLFPLFDSAEWEDLKDPCPVFHDHLWHVYGSKGATTTEIWELFHATAGALTGPWREEPAVALPIQGSGIAAPGVIVEDGVFHMFVQTEFMRPGGRIEHAVSNDGFTWSLAEPAILAIEETSEHGVYDPHPAVIGGVKYLVYSAMPKFERVPQPDIFLARSASGTWFGPWERLGKILDHDDLPHHNAREHPDYEWGIEGAQLVALPDGRVLLNATCFLPTGSRGSRQRVFFAVADRAEGPYKSLGPILELKEAGENGHSTVLVEGAELILMYQSRIAATNFKWRYGLARCRRGSLRNDSGEVISSS